MKHEKTISIILIFAILLFTFPQDTARASTVAYAKPSATGNGDCSSWADACTLQVALSLADVLDEIWVMQGTHTPGTERWDAFILDATVEVYGGFDGTENIRDERDWQNNITILSGDIGIPGDISDNSYNVVMGLSTGNNTRLDGFTISGGNANGSEGTYDRGAGMLNFSNSNPVLANLIFNNNNAVYGAGMANLFASSPTVENVTFSMNQAVDSAGGMYNSDNSSPTLNKVTFKENTAGLLGGGMFNIDNSNPLLTNVTFSNNEAGVDGGGMISFDSSPTLVNTTFSANTAGSRGGGLANVVDTGTTTVRNSIFWGNTAVEGGHQVYNHSGALIISDSIVEGGYISGTNIITNNPLLEAIKDFGNPGEEVYPVSAESAAIDNGNDSYCPDTDQRGTARPIDGDQDDTATCDIGAYEFLPQNNDDFENATKITEIAYSDNISTVLATSELNDPALPELCGITGSGQATVWYTYTPQSDWAISISTANTDYDTFIAVWEGTSKEELRFVACNDDFGDTKQSAVAIRVTGNKTYYIEIGQP